MSKLSLTSSLRRSARHLWLSTPVFWYVHQVRRDRELKEWNLRGKGPTPHLHKRAVVQGYLHRYSLQVVVETGTYLGEMVDGLASVASRVYSIELDKWLFRRAQRRLGRYRNVTLIHGDSADQLGQVIQDLDRPAVFWLDGHYSGGITARGTVDTPVVSELTQILSDSKDHIVLVDDAHAFNGTSGYPTMAGLTALVYQLRPSYRVDVEADIIRLGPLQGESQAR